MITISSGTQAIQIFGEPKVAHRKTLVTIREVNGEEIFHANSSDGELKAVEGIDYVVIPVNGGNSYPCKKEIFHNSWEETETTGVYRKKALCKAIPIPEGVTVTLKTLEGDVVVSHPAWIAVGIEDEVYSYSNEWVEKNLEFVS
jgi:hypothetical protein